MSVVLTGLSFFLFALAGTTFDEAYTCERGHECLEPAVAFLFLGAPSLLAAAASLGAAALPLLSARIRVRSYIAMMLLAALITSALVLLVVKGPYPNR